MSDLAFSSFTLIGVDALKFLQGQVTVNVEALLKIQRNTPPFVT
jgi:folate-binding Fe-S cluster repair protein YgfZ